MPASRSGRGSGPRYVDPAAWPWALAAYALGSLALGYAIEGVGAFLRARGIAGPWAVVVTVNLLFPACLALIAVFYPRPRVVLAGCWVSVLCFTTGMSLAQNPRFWTWTPPAFLQAVHPVVLAAAGAATIASFGIVRLLRPWRVVGVRPDPAACKGCGYHLGGLPGKPCPECGRPSDTLSAA